VYSIKVKLLSKFIIVFLGGKLDLIISISVKVNLNFVQDSVISAFNTNLSLVSYFITLSVCKLLHFPCSLTSTTNTNELSSSPVVRM
jgi:hypothetical protein